MKVFYFCTYAVVRHICRVTGKGGLCPRMMERNFLKRCVLINTLLCHCCCLSAQPSAADSVLLESHSFRTKQVIVPSVMMAVGAYGVSNGWLRSVNHDVRNKFQDLRGNCRFKIDDQLQYLPTIAGACLGFAGVKAQHELKERIAVTATAYSVMGVVVNATKYTVREKRPDSSARNSFPSGHTATAFMGAELVRREYGNAYGTGAYTFATGIAFLRIYNDRHWLNDVIAGAGVGILSVHIAYWLLPGERKLLGWDASSINTAVVPTYQYDTKTLGVTLKAQL